jgi:hypothetical protein
MWTAKFWKETAERAIKTAAQVALTFFVVGETNIASVDFAMTAGVTAGAAIASVLFSLASAPFGPEGSPSLVRE